MTTSVQSEKKSLSLIDSNAMEKDDLQGDKMHKLCNMHEENLHIIEDIELESNSFNLKCIKSSTKFIDGSTLVLHNSEHRKKGVVVGNSLSTVTDGHLWVHLINLTNEKVTLTQGTRFCTAQVWQGDVNENDSVCSLNDEQQDTTSQLRELTIKDIDCQAETMTESLSELLNKYRPVSWLPNEPLGHYIGDPSTIDLKNESVVVNKGQPHSRQEQLKDEINTLLKQGLISRSKSTYNSPLILVPKRSKTGEKLAYVHVGF